MTGVVAQATKRTLVLPPASKMYLLDYGPGMTRMPQEMKETETTTLVEDLINLEQLKRILPTLTAEEFETKTGTTWEAASGKAAQVDIAHMCSLTAYQAVDDKFLFMPGEGPRREGFSCGEWAMKGGPTKALKQNMSDDACIE
jgi:hypothetical protein